MRSIVFVDMSGRQVLPPPYVGPDLTGLAKQGPDGQLKVRRPSRNTQQEYETSLKVLGPSEI